MASALQRAADVIAFPARAVGAQAATMVSDAAGQVREWSTNEVDDWGRDNHFTNRVWALSKLRWTTSVGGADNVPPRAGALIVVNARRFALAPVFAALAIGAAVDRPVRFVGRPDIAPIGPLMQRMGGLLPIADEIEGALRASQLVVLGAEHQLGNERCGTVDHRLVGAAVAAKVRVLPAATASVPLRREARVEIGRAAHPGPHRRGPLAELELADLVARRIDELLEELGGTLPGTPLDWMPVDWLPGLPTRLASVIGTT